MGEFHHILRTTGGHKGLINFTLSHHGTHGYSAVSQAFGKVHNVGYHAKRISTKGSTSAAKSGDHFIKNQQYVVLITNLAQALQITLRWHHYPSRTRKRLYNHSRNVRRIIQSNLFQQVICQLSAMFRQTFSKRVLW